MQLLRTINVLTLASLLILTGCFGLADDTITPADGEDSRTHSDNNEPSSTTFQNTDIQFEPNMVYDQTTGDEIITGLIVSVYSAAVDPDGDNITCGWDTGLDGNVDYPTNCAGEFTNLTIPIASWIEIPGETNQGINSIALIVTDENGASIADILNLNTALPIGELEDDNSGGSLALYDFDSEDAAGSPTNGTSDDLVHVTMMQGMQKSWASISISISVDNGAPITCSYGDASGNCEVIEFGNTGDQFWSVGDGVTIVESGQDLCTSGGVCMIQVTITDTMSDNIIHESTAIAE